MNRLQILSVVDKSIAICLRTRHCHPKQTHKKIHKNEIINDGKKCYQFHETQCHFTVDGNSFFRPFSIWNVSKAKHLYAISQTRMQNNFLYEILNDKRLLWLDNVTCDLCAASKSAFSQMTHWIR